MSGGEVPRLIQDVVEQMAPLVFIPACVTCGGKVIGGTFCENRCEVVRRELHISDITGVAGLDRPATPRRFQLHRDTDVSGVSGTGIVADGVMWPDGTASIRWRGEHASMVFWDRGMASVEHVHGHGGATRVVWLDGEPWGYRPGCPHCDPNHGDPGDKSWGVYVASDRDGDGQPTRLYVLPSDGAHVADSDAEWLRQLIRRHG